MLTLFDQKKACVKIISFFQPQREVKMRLTQLQTFPVAQRWQSSWTSQSAHIDFLFYPYGTSMPNQTAFDCFCSQPRDPWRRSLGSCDRPTLGVVEKCFQALSFFFTGPITLQPSCPLRPNNLEEKDVPVWRGSKIQWSSSGSPLCSNAKRQGEGAPGNNVQ